ncbi:MAG: hypothetical protein M5U07_24430 [Xanthobacteraceae bacterium]|nr:hypothetical protein [Xanthobacteraceae bacterium]
MPPRPGATLLALLLVAGCVPERDAGYVEIKTVPVASLAPTPLYLDSVKLAPLKSGVAMLRQQVGTARLEAESAGGKLALCDVVVKKNRITSVTVSFLERPPRCQCRSVSGTPGAMRSCAG